MSFNKTHDRSYTHPGMVLIVTAIVRPRRAIGGAKGRRRSNAHAIKRPRGFNGIIILRCVRVVVKRNIGSPLGNLYLWFLGGLEGSNAKDALNVMSLERFVELDEEWLWHHGLMEFLGRGNEFELVGMIGVALEDPRHWENARV